jgi:hypothetical protein
MVAQLPRECRRRTAVVVHHQHQVLAHDGGNGVLQLPRHRRAHQRFVMGRGDGQQHHVLAGAVHADAGEAALGLTGFQRPVDYVLQHLPAQGTLGLALLDHVVQFNADQVLGVADNARVLEGLADPQRAGVAPARGDGVGGPGVRLRGVRAAVVQLGSELGEGNVRPQHAAQMLEELGQAPARQQCSRQDLVPGDQALELGIVVRRLGVSHQLADGDERRRVGDLHNGQAPPVRLREQCRRHRVMRKPHTKADAHGAGPLHLPHEPPLLGRRLQPQAGGKDQFTAIDEPLRVLEFGHCHPVDVLVPGGLGYPCLGQVQGLDTQKGSEGNGHEPRISGR